MIEEMPKVPVPIMLPAKGRSCPGRRLIAEPFLELG